MQGLQMKASSPVLLLLPLLVALLSCADSSGGGVASIEIAPAASTLPDGSSTQLSVTLRDARGRILQRLPEGAEVRWSSSSSAVLSVSEQGQLTGERPGQAEITATVTLPPRTGPTTLPTGGATLAGAGRTLSVSMPVQVTQVATRLEYVSGSEQQGTAGEPLPEPLVVRVTDRHGEAVPGAAVQFAVTSGNGGSLSSATASTDAQGRASASWTLSPQAGQNSARAAASGLTGSPVDFQAVGMAGPPSELVKVSGDEQSGEIRTELPEPLVVRVTDVHGNTVAGVSVTWAVTAGGGTVTPLISTTDAVGLAQTRLRLGPAAGVNTITAAAVGKTVSFTAEAFSTEQNCSQVRTFGDGETISGELPSVRITGNVTVAAETRICGSLAIDGANANLRLNGRKVEVEGRFDTHNHGTFTLQNAADELIVGGVTELRGGDSEGRLSAGVIRLQGSVTAHCFSARELRSTGTLLSLEGSIAQNFDMHCSQATQQFLHNLRISNTAGVNLLRNVFASGNTQVETNSVLTMATNATLTVQGNVTSSGVESGIGGHGLAVGGTLSVGGSYSVANTTFTGTNQNIPVLGYQNLFVTGTARLTGNTNTSGRLEINGTSANLSLNGRRLNVEGRFDTQNHGTFNLQDAADELIVGGPTELRGGDSEGRLSAGVLRLKGNVTVHCFSAREVRFTGTLLSLEGSALQNFDLHCSNPTQQFLHNLRISNAAGVNVLRNSFATGNLQVEANSALTMATSATLTMQGNVTSGSGSTLGGHGLSIGGTLNVGGSYAVANTTFAGTNQNIPVLPYQNLFITGTARLTGNTSASGRLEINGNTANLTFNGRRLDVEGRFDTQNHGTFTLQNAADELIVGGPTELRGGDSEGRLSAGVIRLQGSVTAHCFSARELRSTGTLLSLEGSIAQNFDMHCSQATQQFLHNLRISNTAGVNLLRNVFASGNTQVETNSVLTMATNATLTVQGNVTSSGVESGIGGHGLAVGGTLSVGGSYSVANTTFTGTNQNIPVLGYQNLFVTGTARLTGNTNTSGRLEINGTSANLSLNGRRLNVEGRFDTQNHGTFNLQDAADELIVGGPTELRGGDSEGRLSAGVIRLRANVTAHCFSARELRSTGTLVSLEGSAAQSFDMHCSQATQQFLHNLRIANAAGVNIVRNTRVNNELDLVRQMTVPAGVTVSGLQRLILRSTSVLNNQGTIQTAACTQEPGRTINGTNPCP